jgi:hypothetical protein
MQLLSMPVSVLEDLSRRSASAEIKLWLGRATEHRQPD